jgi:putative transposase
MPNYHRWFVPGGTYAFTVVTCARAPVFRDRRARRLMGAAMRTVGQRFPFRIVAIVLLPDHLHCLWTLPRGDENFSVRWNQIKRRFSESWLKAGGAEIAPSPSRTGRGERGVWQRRFWEHVVRDEQDLERCCDYIHYNPVKHGYVARPWDWEWSSFRRFVRAGQYPADWGRSEPPTCRACRGIIE